MQFSSVQWPFTSVKIDVRQSSVAVVPWKMKGRAGGHLALQCVHRESSSYMIIKRFRHNCHAADVQLREQRFARRRSRADALSLSPQGRVRRPPSGRESCSELQWDDRELSS